MSFLPEKLIESLKGVPGFDEPAFRNVHEAQASLTSVRLNRVKPFPPGAGVANYSGNVPWAHSGRYLTERPFFTFDPLLHAGAYYVQEASSMFLEQALIQHGELNVPRKVLDLCAAPGGKSTLIQSLLSAESLLVSNEVIRSRATILDENMTKWGAANVVVTNNDPRDFNRIPGFFDIIVADAPCSGSGLFRKDSEAVKEWSPENVQLCSLRQQRILADVWPALAEGGLLVYSTCSYSAAENEEITDWIINELGAESLSVGIYPEWGITESFSPENNGAGYRFYPDKVKGEGFYLSCFRKTAPTEGGWKTPAQKKKKNSVTATAIPRYLLKDAATLSYLPLGDSYLAVPVAIEQDVLLLQSGFYLKKAGVLLGKPSFKEWVPDHALALSLLPGNDLPRWELGKEDALQYLRRENFPGMPDFKGWGLVTYAGLPLGWVKALPNRINNYYPAGWRILKKA